MPFISRLGGSSAKGFGFGGASLFRHTITSNQQEIDLYNYLRNIQWMPWQPIELTIDSGVYIWSDDTSTAALTIPSTVLVRVTLINNGYIIGRGGNGGDKLQDGQDGGPAISNAASNVTLINSSGALIGGGGGGGGGGSDADSDTTTPVAGGGGGAGGGRGGAGSTSGGAGGAPGYSGSNSGAGGNNTTGIGGPNGGAGGGRQDNNGVDSGSGGGGGGRKATDTDGVNASIPSGTGLDNPGGYGGGQNQAGGAYGYPYWASPSSAVGRNTMAAGGGGGYGQSGGSSGGTGGSGGSGGAAISGTAVTLTNNGTILGSTP